MCQSSTTSWHFSCRVGRLNSIRDKRAWKLRFNIWMVSRTVTIYDLYQDRRSTKKIEVSPEGHHRAAEMKWDLGETAGTSWKTNKLEKKLVIVRDRRAFFWKISRVIICGSPTTFLTPAGRVKCYRLDSLSFIFIFLGKIKRVIALHGEKCYGLLNCTCSWGRWGERCTR